MSRWLPAAILFGFGWSATVHGGDARELFIEGHGDEAVILDTSYDVIVAKIDAVSGPEGTNREPPRVTLEVTEVLRGDPALIRREAVWAPFPRPWAWCSVGVTKKEIAKWEATPIAAPTPGERYVLAGEIQGSRFRVSAYGRFPFSDDRRRWALQEIEHATVLEAEAKESVDAWPESGGFTHAQLLDGARPVTPETVLDVGDPILIQWAMLSQGRVTGLLADGRVQVRTKGHDSRWDEEVDRETLLLYPERLLADPRSAAATRPD